LGWVSIACWIIVYSPQIYENYSLQSGEGLSVVFVVIWLLGDLANLVGAIEGRLLLTIILLAVYYSVCDLTLLGQIYYYRWKRNRQLEESSDEREPLLNQLSPQPLGNSVLLLRYTGALCFVFLIGILAWWINSRTEGKVQTPPPEKELRWDVQVLGWTSAILYVCAHSYGLKNFKTRCEGLSPALFYFAIFGNITYTLSICAKSIDTKYLTTNAGWLAGSALTVVLDVFVLCQIFYYRSTD
ncbi:hypothetical protein J132_05296, partial [Termitomyces sp. J132]